MRSGSFASASMLPNPCLTVRLSFRMIGWRLLPSQCLKSSEGKKQSGFNSGCKFCHIPWYLTVIFLKLLTLIDAHVVSPGWCLVCRMVCSTEWAFALSVVWLWWLWDLWWLFYPFLLNVKWSETHDIWWKICHFSLADQHIFTSWMIENEKDATPTTRFPITINQLISEQRLHSRLYVLLCTEMLSWPVQSYLAEKPSISCCMHVGRAPARFIALSKIEISLSSAN